VLPAAASFKEQGANRGALASFLVSTPESGVDSIAVTYALLDPVMTVARPLAAFFSGITAGFLENTLSWNDDERKEGSGEGERVAHEQNDDRIDISLAEKLKYGLKYGFKEIWADIALWFFVGLLLAGIITVYLPESLSQLVLGGGVLAMLAMLLMGMPIYICATASTPIAAAFLLKGASPGAVLVFLLVGPATNMTSLSVLVKILGKMGTMRYLLVIAVVSILFGLGLDAFYDALNLEARALVAEVRETIPGWLKFISAVTLLVMFTANLYERFRLYLVTRKRTMYVSGFPDISAQNGTMQNSTKRGASIPVRTPVDRSVKKS